MANPKLLFSVLGDSISTFEDCSATDGAYYTRAFSSYTGVTQPEETWWMQVIQKLGGTLLANDSWSGSTVSAEGVMPACSSSRVRRLGPGGTAPDHILVYTGLNDVNLYLPPEHFRQDYEIMLNRLKAAYPEAIISCGTLAMGYLDQPPFSPPLYFKKRAQEYNDLIREAVQAAGCTLVDLAASGEDYPTVDGLHPNKRGMARLAALWLAAMGHTTPD